MTTTTITFSERLQPLLQPLLRPEQYDFWARQLGFIDAWKRCFARVTEVRHSQDGTTILTLHANRHSGKHITSGYCDISLEINGRNSARTYELVDKVDRRRLQIKVNGNADDPVSLELRQRIHAGDIIELRTASSDLSEESSYSNAIDSNLDTAQVFLRRSKKTVTVARDVSLLEALEQAGVQPTYGCRRGICNRCSCMRHHGNTTDMATGNESNESGESIRICISRASSNLELDL